MEAVRVVISNPFDQITLKFLEETDILKVNTVYVSTCNKDENVHVSCDMFNKLYPIKAEFNDKVKELPEGRNIYDSGTVVNIGTKLPLLMIRFLAILSKGQNVDETISFSELLDLENGILTYISITTTTPASFSEQLKKELLQLYKTVINPDVFRRFLEEKHILLFRQLHCYDLQLLDKYAKIVTVDEFENKIYPELLNHQAYIKTHKDRYKVYLLIMMICYHLSMKKLNLIISEELFELLRSMVPMFICQYINDWYSVSLSYSNCSVVFSKLLHMMIGASVSLQFRSTPSSISIPFDGEKLPIDTLYNRGLDLFATIDLAKSAVPVLSFCENPGHCFTLAKRGLVEGMVDVGEKRPRTEQPVDPRLHKPIQPLQAPSPQTSAKQKPYTFHTQLPDFRHARPVGN